MQCLGKKRGQEVIENSRLSPLASHVERLPMADAIDVFVYVMAYEELQQWVDRGKWLTEIEGRLRGKT
jgi:hypothetical protein